jgi:hypothetical protein
VKTKSGLKSALRFFCKAFCFRPSTMGPWKEERQVTMGWSWRTVEQEEGTEGAQKRREIHRTGGMAQVVVHLPSKCKALSSNPSTTLPQEKQRQERRLSGSGWV